MFQMISSDTTVVAVFGDRPVGDDAVGFLGLSDELYFEFLGLGSRRLGGRL
jgi:hypothetical protein